MLCPSVFQSSPAHMGLMPFLEPHWPIRSLWPETRPIFQRIEQQMVQRMQEMRNNMEYMERLHQKIFEELEREAGLAPLAASAYKPIAFQMGQGGDFTVNLDTKDFSPDELTVKQVGRKLRVSGKMERKQDDGKGSSSYRCQEFRQEFDVPEGVDPEAITCSLAGGHLQIQAPCQKTGDGKERVVPIKVTPAAITSSQTNQAATTSPVSTDSTASTADKNHTEKAK